VWAVALLPVPLSLERGGTNRGTLRVVALAIYLALRRAFCLRCAPLGR
jgi:hypothetical protein